MEKVVFGLKLGELADISQDAIMGPCGDSPTVFHI
jgi:hypothetical protein